MSNIEKNAYSFNKEMLEKCASIHKFFKNGKKYNHKYSTKDYVLDGYSSFLFYNLIQSDFGGIINISVSDKISKSVILNKLAKANLHYVRVYKRRPREIISSNLDLTKKDSSNNYKMINIWTYEKLFLYLDSFDFCSTQKTLIIERLIKLSSLRKIKILKDIHSRTKRPISEAAQDFISGSEEVLQTPRHPGKTKLMYTFLKKEKNYYLILMGGFATEIHLKKAGVKNTRKTENLNLWFEGSHQYPELIYRTLKNLNFDHTFLEKQEYINSSRTNSFVIKDNRKTPNLKRNQLKVIIDDSFQHISGKEFLNKGIIQWNDEIGFIVTPETNVCYNLSNTTPSISYSSFEGCSDYSLKFLIDNALLIKHLKLSQNKIKEIYNYLDYHTNISYIDKDNLKTIVNYVQNDKKTHSNLKLIIKVNELDLTLEDIQESLKMLMLMIV